MNDEPDELDFGGILLGMIEWLESESNDLDDLRRALDESTETISYAEFRERLAAGTPA